MFTPVNSVAWVRARHIGRATLVLGCCGILMGCAAGGSGSNALSGGAAPASLSEQRLEITRRLAAQCYWHHEGERVVLGGHEVYMACRDWAERRVGAQWPRQRLY